MDIDCKSTKKPVMVRVDCLLWRRYTACMQLRLPGLQHHLTLLPA